MKTKLCSKCETEKPVCDFSFKNKATNRRDTACKQCKREYGKFHYRSNKDVYKKRAAAFSKKVREVNSCKIVEYLKLNPCVDCGEKDVVVLQFDHLFDKRDSISSMLRSGLSWETIKAEISKCEVRCANCHIRRTAKVFKWRWKQSEED